MRKRKHRWARMIVALALAPLLLFGLLQTGPGKALLAETLTRLLSRSDGLEVRVSGISGWIPGDVTIESLEIADANGVWLEASGARFRWMIRDAFEGRVTFAKLGADEIHWSRFPRLAKRAEKTRRESSEFTPVEARLEDLRVKRLRVGKSVAGVELEYAVSSGGVVYSTLGELNGRLMVGGDAEGEVRISAALTGSEDDHLKIVADLRRMQNPSFGLDRLAGHGEALVDAQGVEARIAARMVKGETDARIRTELAYRDRALSLSGFELTSEGYALSGDLALGFTNRTILVDLDSAFTDAATNRFSAVGSAVVATSNQTWGVRVDDLELRGLEVFTVNFRGDLGPEAVDLRGSLKPMEFVELPWAGSSNFVGRVTGEIAVGGSLEEPEVVGALAVNGLASAEDALDELPELDFSIMGGVAEGAFFAATEITNYASGRFRADYSAPCDFSLSPFRYEVDRDDARFHVDGDLDLAIFNQLAVFQNQLLRGVLRAEVDYVDGEPNGFLRLENGRYEHYDWGVVFYDFNADLVATADGFKTRSASATDGANGVVTMTGGLGAGGLDLRLDFQGAQVIRRDELEASMSGWLGVTGRPQRPRIGGELTIDRAEILLDNIAVAPPPLLTDYDASATNLVGVAVQKERKRPPVGLDVKIVMPAQVFIISSMIEATLEGELRVTDVAEGVSVAGRIEPRRGFVNFIGRKFRFTEGDILLDGSVPTIALLNGLTAEYARRDVTARLVLNGPANDPRFRLESSPPLPEDEVISHVLFNRDTSSISPYQAYQIATAARQLSGGLNGPGFMFQVRRAIGVDTLEWREADAAGGATSVAAGKYIGSGLYVEVNRELDARGQTGMSAEYEVSRHISLETYTGPKMRPGIGVNWRNDY